MSAYSRDLSIYGHHLLPFALLHHDPEDPMQHVKDLESDLAFCAAQGNEKHEAAVITSQATVKGVLAALASRDATIAELTARAEKAEGNASQFHHEVCAHRVSLSLLATRLRETGAVEALEHAARNLSHPDQCVDAAHTALSSLQAELDKP